MRDTRFDEIRDAQQRHHSFFSSQASLRHAHSQYLRAMRDSPENLILTYTNLVIAIDNVHAQPKFKMLTEAANMLLY